MAKLLPFAGEEKRARRSQSWTCLCPRRHRQAWSGLSLIATGGEGPGERIPVLRFPSNRSSADEKRDGRVAHPLTVFAYANTTEGAPSLRILQGRVTVLSTQVLSSSGAGVRVPAHRELREGRGTHRIA